jgi:hypothetical protein
VVKRNHVEVLILCQQNPFFKFILGGGCCSPAVPIVCVPNKTYVCFVANVRMFYCK